MVDDLVTEVRMEKKSIIISSSTSPNSSLKKGRKKVKKQTTAKKEIGQLSCPKCKKGGLLKGKTSYGCSLWKSGCTFRLPFKIFEKKISDNQLRRLVEKGCTTNLKGFTLNDQKVNGLIRFDDQFNFILEQPKSKNKTAQTTEMPTCPKCKKGHLIKGKTAYGCSDWKIGCNFKFLFSEIKEKAKGQKLTKELVMKIIST